MKRIVSIIGTVLVVGSVACSAAGAVTAPSTDEVGLRDPSVAGEFGNEQQDSALSVTHRELAAEFGFRDPSLESEFGNERSDSALSVTDRELVAEFGLRDPSLESEFGNE